MRRGKKYLEAVKKYNKQEKYSWNKACEIVKSLSFAKFDESVEISVDLNLKKSQSVRDTLVFPNQFSAEKRILVFAKGEKATEAKEAGATFVGDTDLVQKIQAGWTDFDVAVATPDMMKDVGRLGPVLGRKGLMPNPKTGTVTMDITSTIAELKKGRVEFRTDKQGVVHLAIGKVSMSPDKVCENAKVIFSEISRKKPVDVKGDFIKSVVVSSTMGPGVKIDFMEKDKE